MKSYAELERAALEARAHAYAPYSGFLVGAALLARDGRVFAGANVENASYALSVCAERAAVIGAVLAGARDLEAIAIATASSPPASPCGACLQTLAEFADDLAVVLINQRGERHSTTLGALLPRAFKPGDLPR
ncbi:MAG TPA: cytidine deaminase [Polyangia bacterium]|nr:cytidine deaminase [Polyangia bacterium]